MAATGILADARAQIVDAVTAAGLVPVTDPRNARPLTVFVDLPTAAGFNNNILDITTTVRILAAPPANADAADYLLTAADTLHQSPDLAVIAVEPNSIQVGEQLIPTYDLTCRLAVRRTGTPAVTQLGPISRFRQNREFITSTTVTTGGTANTWGAWVQQVASSSATVDVIRISSLIAANATNTATLLRIGIGSSGSETVIASNIPIAGHSTDVDLVIPIRIPAGTRIAFSSQGIIPSRGSTIKATYLSVPSYVTPSLTRSTTLGASVATSRGTEINGSNTNIIELGTLAVPAQSIAVIPSAASNDVTSATVQWEVLAGPSGQETKIGDVVFRTFNTETILMGVGFDCFSDRMFPGPFQSGTRFSIRRVSGATADAAIVAIHD